MNENNFIKRSSQMPPTPETILPHARSLNNITLSHLLRPTTTTMTTSSSSTHNSSDSNSMVNFLTTSLAGVSTKTANSIVTALGLQEILPSNLNPSQVN